MAIHTATDPVRPRTVLPAAASRALRPALEGPIGRARLLAVFPTAVYLATADGTVLALLTTDAVRLPNSLVVATDGASPLTDVVHEGDAAGCGAGFLRIGGLRVRAARWWKPRHPSRPRDRTALRVGTAELGAFFHATGRPKAGLPGSGHPALADLARYTVKGDGPAAAEAAARLIGLGPGLTPSGDDVLSGFLLALHHLVPATRARPMEVGEQVPWRGTTDRDDEVARLGARVAALAAGRTTDLSAALLGHAAGGDGCDPVIDVIDAVAGHQHLAPALARLLTVGHTSGADLCLGVLAGARTALARWPTR
ncbi:DUF2877 domain-containing protein [Streptomyces sp. NPDC020801]|uniref:DUF2877 domain-containing protein n=1 Tax=unclassified Streptomyces TaxID=2593676 RepID=UPI0037A546C5